MASKRESRILKLLSEKEGRSLSEGSILRGLDMPERKRKNLRAVLDRMVLEGKLERTSKDRYRLRKSGKKGYRERPPASEFSRSHLKREPEKYRIERACPTGTP